MTYFKTIVSLTLAAGLCACTATSQNGTDVKQASEQNTSEQAVSNQHEHKFTGHRATIKPGANISMTSALPKTLASGSYQTVQLSFTEGYDSGAMSVSIAPSAGLSLFGGTSSKTFDMGTPGAHIWNVDVKADVDGVYFLNVFAEAEGRPRTFSVRINMGQVTQKMFDDAMPADGSLSDGGKMRILEADETIR